MKCAKYALFSFLIIVVFLMTGELYQGYLNSFTSSDFYTTSFYMKPDIEKQTMLKDIYAAAERNGISVFVMHEETKNSFSSTVKIYADEKTLNVLEKEYRVFDKNFVSLFSGSTDIQTADFFDIPDDYMSSRKPLYYMIGGIDEVRAFKVELINTYGGGFPKQSGYDRLKENKNTITAVWIVVVLLMIFQTFYELERDRKKITLNLIFGESAGIIFLKNVISDSAAFSIIFFAIKTILSFITCTQFFSEISYTALVVLLLVNAIVYLGVFRINVKFALSNAMNSNKLLTINYILCGASMLVTSLVIAVNFSMINDYIQFDRQESFFEKNRNSNYCELRKRNASIFETSQMLYYEFAEDHKVQNLDVGLSLSYDKDEDAYLITSDTKDFLAEWIPEVFSGELNQPGYIIMPEDMTFSDDENMSWLKKHLANHLYGTELYESPENIPVIRYKNDCSIISVEEDYPNRSVWVKNPIIMYLNIKHYPEIPPDAWFRTYNLLIEADEAELREVAEKYGCECVITNVFDYYNHQKIILSRTLVIASITCVIVIILNIAILISTIRLEFQVNAMRNTILKTIGYSLISRIKKLYISLLITDLISMLSACIISGFTGFGNVPLIIVMTVIFGACEALIINVFARREDRLQIQKILKGGLL